MKTINIYRAQPVGSWVPEPVTITIADVLPDQAPDKQGIALSNRQFEGDAHALASALHAALPGGTFDQLVVELLRRKASLLRVGYREVSDVS